MKELLLDEEKFRVFALILAIVITAALLLLPGLLAGRSSWDEVDRKRQGISPEKWKEIKANRKRSVPAAAANRMYGNTGNAGPIEVSDIIANLRVKDENEKELTWFRLTLVGLTYGFPIGCVIALVCWITKWQDFFGGIEVGAMCAVVIALFVGAGMKCKMGLEKMSGLPWRFYVKPLLLLPLAAVGCYFFTKYVGYPLLIKFFQGWDKLLGYYEDYSQGMADCPFERAFGTALVFVVAAWLSEFHTASCFRYWVPLLLSFALPALVACFIMLPIAFVIFCMFAVPLLAFGAKVAECILALWDTVFALFGIW